MKFLPDYELMAFRENMDFMKSKGLIGKQILERPRLRIVLNAYLASLAIGAIYLGETQMGFSRRGN